jgi:hypothetical protein
LLLKWDNLCRYMTVALEATAQSLADVKTELASQEQMVVEVGAAVECGRKREVEMMQLLQEAATAEKALEAGLYKFNAVDP